MQFEKQKMADTKIKYGQFDVFYRIRSMTRNFHRVSLQFSYFFFFFFIFTKINKKFEITVIFFSVERNKLLNKCRFKRLEYNNKIDENRSLITWKRKKKFFSSFVIKPQLSTFSFDSIPNDPFFSLFFSRLYQFFFFRLNFYLYRDSVTNRIFLVKKILADFPPRKIGSIPTARKKWNTSGK